MKKDYILESLLILVCCLIVGIIFFSMQIFNTRHYAFQFIVYGIYSTVFILASRSRNIRSSILFSLLCFLIIYIIINKKIDFSFLLRDFLFYLAITLTCYFYLLKYKSLKLNDFYIPLYFAVLIGLFSIFNVLILAVYNSLMDNFNFQNIFPILIINAKTCFLIGLAIGLGIYLGMKLQVSSVLKDV